MKTVETKMVHFIIEGEFITNLIREVWVEGRLKYALELLDSCNCPKEWWLKILTGQAKMVGENEFHIEKDSVESLYGISLQIEDLVPRLEEQLIKAKADLINAEQRLSYWPLRMDIDGVRYKTNKSGEIGYTSYIDEAISKKRGEEVIQLSTLFDFVYPLVGKTMKDFPEHRVGQLLDEPLDLEHPRYLPNMRKEAYKPLTVKEVFDREMREEDRVDKEYKEEVIARKVSSPPIPEAIKNYPGVEFKILKNPWEGVDYRYLSDHELTNPIPWNLGAGVEYIDNEVKHTSITPKNPRQVFLEITSWRGISIGAIHYYGKLHFWGLDIVQEGQENSRFRTSYFGKDLKVIQSIDINLTRPLTTKDLKMGDRFKGYRLGDNITNFDTKQDAIKRGKEIFQKFFVEGWKLKIEDHS